MELKDILSHNWICWSWFIFGLRFFHSRALYSRPVWNSLRCSCSINSKIKLCLLDNSTGNFKCWGKSECLSLPPIFTIPSSRNGLSFTILLVTLIDFPLTSAYISSLNAFSWSNFISSVFYFLYLLAFFLSARYAMAMISICFLDSNYHLIITWQNFVFF